MVTCEAASVESSEQSDSVGLTSQHVIRGRSAIEQPVDGWPSQYEATHAIGSGGQARVFGARDARGRAVAIKVPHVDTVARSRFRREVEALERCRHRHIMPLLDQGDAWYAMPAADGALGALAPALSEEERLEVIAHVAEGLAHAHALDCCHRDVTPGNVMRLSDDLGRRWVIGDFGTVRVNEDETAS